jgi:hypothetical protein
VICSQRHLKPHERFSTPNYRVYQTDYFQDRKGRNVAFRKGIPDNCAELSLVPLEATRVCILIGNTELLLAAVYKTPVHPWS